MAAVPRVWAIVPAAGRGERFDPAARASVPKQYAPLAGATVLEWSLRPLLREPRVHAVVVVLAPGDLRWAEIAPSLDSGKLQTAVGGASRQESVMNGLRHLEARAAPHDWILVHDAARPCLTARDLRALIDAVDNQASIIDAASHDTRGNDTRGQDTPANDTAGNDTPGHVVVAAPRGAVLGSPVVDTVKRERDGVVVETVDRRGLWRALTPQVFAFAQLRHALEEAVRDGVAVTDEAQAMERQGAPAMLVRGSPFNIKVTRAEDLVMAAEILQQGEAGMMRIGQGFDVHAFGDGNHVVLGGVRIAHDRGVIAHSDGDVVIHALCDALLGALGMGDIGRHFPDSDPRYRGADSRVFLREVAAHMRAAGLKLFNADVTVLAEAPRIAAHSGAMAQNLAADLGASARCINIKATTTEHLGFVGRGEGLAALAGVLLGV